MAGTIAHTTVGTECAQNEFESVTLHTVSGVAGVIVLTSGDIDNTAYATSWSGKYTTAPSKAAVYNKIEAMGTTDSGFTTTIISATQHITASGIGTFGAGVVTPTHISGRGNATISGVIQAGAGLTTPTHISAGGNVMGDNILAKQMDTTIANGSWDGRTISGVVAQLTSATQLLYQKSSGYWDLADADSELTAGGMLVMATATIASAAAGVLLVEGLIRNDSGFGGSLAIGLSGTYFVGTTPGALLVKASAPSGAGDIVRVAGYGLCADVPRLFNFKPSTTYFEHS